MALNRDKVSASAIKLLQSGKFDKAISEFVRLVEDDPKDVRTLLKLGDTYVKVGRRDDAVGSYQAVADIYSEQGFYLKAVAVFKQMLRVDANLPQVHLQLAEMYQQLGLHSDCMQHYQQVAVFYERQGLVEETLDVLKRMVDLDPDNLPSRIKLAELFAQQGKNDKAIEEFRSAAAYLKQHERFDDYVRVAERLVYFDPSAIDATRELAQLYLQRGDAKLALGKLQTCFKADPRNLDTLGLIAEAFLAMDQVAKTISVYKEMARIHESTGNVAEAQARWNRVIELVPDDGEARQALGLGGAHVQAAPVAAAAAAAPLAAAPRPAAPAAPAVDPEEEQIARLLTETDVYVKYRLRDKAVEHLQKVFALRPDHIDAHDRLRDLHQQMGNKAGLVEELRVLVRLGGARGDPRTGGWQRDLALVEQALGGAPAAAVVEADDLIEDDGLIVLDDSPDGSDELLLDPGLDDEPMGLGGDVHELGLPPRGEPRDLASRGELPPDESLLEDEALIDDEELIEPIGEYGSGPAPVLEVSPQAGYADDLLDMVDDQLPMAPAAVEVPALPAEVFDATGEVADLNSLPSATADAVLQPSEAADLDGLDDALGAELAAAAAAGIDQLDAGFSSEGFSSPPDSLADGLGEGESFFNMDAFQAAEASVSGEGDPAGFDLDDQGGVVPGAGSEGYASTEIMSLSPEEMAEIRAMAQPSQARSQPPFSQSDEEVTGPGLRDARVATGSLLDEGGASDDFDEFSDATVASPVPGFGKAPPAPQIEDLGAELEGLGLSPADADAFDGISANRPAEVASGEYMAHADAFDDGDSFMSEESVGDLDGDLAGYDLGSSGGLGDYRDATDRVDASAATLADDLGPRETGIEVPAAALLGTQDLGSMDAPLPEEFADFSDASGEPSATMPQGRLGAEIDGGHLVSSESGSDPWSSPATGGIQGVPDGFGDLGSGSQEGAALGEKRTPKLGVSESAYGFEDDPAAAFYPDELEEAEFFIVQELLDEAREILEEILDDVPDSPRVKWMLARVEAKENDLPEPPAPWAEKVMELVEEDVGDLLDGLGLAEPEPDQVSVDEVLAAFKKGVAETVDEGDAETHYNLGIAYREMGLVDDAVSEFEIAAKAPSKAADSRHLIGLCYIDLGRHHDALQAFERALASDDMPKLQKAANEYQIGICQEELGHPGEALQAYRRAREHGASQGDIEARIQRMTAALVGDSGEGAPANGKNGLHTPAGVAGEDPLAHRKKNIDYV